MGRLQEGDFRASPPRMDDSIRQDLIAGSGLLGEKEEEFGFPVGVVSGGLNSFGWGL